MSAEASSAPVGFPVGFPPFGHRLAWEFLGVGNFWEHLKYLWFGRVNINGWGYINDDINH